MNNRYLILCRGCWRVHETGGNSNTCGRHSGSWFSKSAAKAGWTEFRGEFRQLLWTIFPHCEINENVDLTGIHLGYDPLDRKLLFDFEIPEYRLVIDIEDKTQIIPTGASGDDYIRRLAFDEVKEIGTRDINYRRVVLPRDIETARNILLEKINEFYVLKCNDGIQILSPKLQGDAGWDIVTGQDIVCPPDQGTDIPSELFLEIPNHLYAVVQARSSTSKKRLLVLPGTIDAGYRGKIYVMVYNLTKEPILIKKGDRIAQLLFFNRVPHLKMVEVDELRKSQRGHAGFGSTG